MDKRLTIYAGVNGAGKSTLFKTEPIIGIRINPDEMLLKNNGDWRNPQDQMNAARECLKLQKECLDKGASFNRETTFSSNEIISTINKAIKHGYYIEINFVGLENVDLSKKRVQARVLKGGHGIADELIEKRFIKSIHNLKEVVVQNRYDNINIYDNSSEKIKFIANIKHGEVFKLINIDWFDNINFEIGNK